MKTLLATLVGATLMATVPAQAATDFYLTIAGVKGDSTVRDYVGQIPVLAWSWGASYAGSAGNPNPSLVSVQDLSWTQYLDGSFVPLFNIFSTAGTIGSATLSAVGAGAGGYNFFQLVLTDGFISSYATGGSSGEDRLTANFSMGFSAITLRYRPTVGGTWSEGTFTVPLRGAPALFSGDAGALEGLQMALSSPVAVPEPASWALMLGGMVLTGAALRRRLPR